MTWMWALVSTERCRGHDSPACAMQGLSHGGAHLVYERYERPFMKPSFMSLMRR